MIKKQLKITVTKDKTKVKVFVTPPSYKVEQELKTAYAVAYRRAVTMGVATRSSMLELLKKEKVWGDEEDAGLMRKNIEAAAVEVELANALRKDDLNTQRSLALKLMGLRSELYALVQVKATPLQHTAEAIADDVKLDKFISMSTFYEDGKPYFKDHEDFLVRRHEEDVIKIYEELLRELSKDNIEVIRSLPENKWLIDNGMMGKNGEIKEKAISDLLSAETQSIQEQMKMETK